MVLSPYDYERNLPTICFFFHSNLLRFPWQEKAKTTPSFLRQWIFTWCLFLHELVLSLVCGQMGLKNSPAEFRRGAQVSPFDSIGSQ